MRIHSLHRTACLLLMSASFLSGVEPPKDHVSRKAKPPVEAPADIRVERDVAYLAEDRKEKADLYFPMAEVAKKTYPAIIVIHGGGFNDGDKARQREVSICTDLVRGGYAAMSINYKLWNSGVTKPTWPQSLHDAKTAVRWLRSNSERLSIDPERIGVLGCSAGGNLATMLALTRPEDGLEPSHPLPGVSTKVQCAVDVYGAVDLPNYHDMKMFLQTREENPGLYEKASPVNYAHAGATPILIIHGTADETVPLSQSESLANQLKKVGAPHRFIVIEGAPHTFDLQPTQRDLRPDVLSFLDKHLRHSAQ